MVAWVRATLNTRCPEGRRNDSAANMYVSVNACVCACARARRRIHKLPVPELEGCPGASANPLLGDLGSYRFHSPAFVFFRLFINSRSKLAIAPVCFVLFPPAGYFADISTTILVTWCRKIIPFFCSSAECRRQYQRR